MAEDYVLEMHGITKHYFGNRVLNDVTLRVKPGEIHGLVGENGAGKSTLMNILFGMPVIHSTGGFQGEIKYCGNQVIFNSPRQALESGIGMVHQEFMLIPGFTVAENIKLNREPLKDSFLTKAFGQRMKKLDWLRIRSDSRAALDTVGLGIDEMLPVVGLPVGYMQFIEIAREVDKEGVRLLVFDEPTALLTETESEQLLSAIKRIAATGVAVIFISHRLDEVLSICENVTVMRDGEVVTSVGTPDPTTTIERIAELMVGRKVERPEYAKRTQEPSDEDTILNIENLEVDMPGEEVHGITLSVRRGEILGIGGLAGQGKIGISNGIMGLFPAQGLVTKDGSEIPLNDPGHAYQQKLAFLSEDRKVVGLILDRPIEYNVTVVATLVKSMFQKTFGARSRGIEIRDKKSAWNFTMQMIRELDIRCTGPGQIVRRLSGGNQQKVCIARALALEPEILLVSEPTRGIDVGAKERILDLLVSLNREKGMTIILTSSELAELRKVCDRIAVIYGGNLVDILSPDDSNARFGLTMSGRRAEAQ
ncbi:MAG TPA: sugar ABC transporter ATP-binding protein [Firmicutes bacterium]|nr:sugar ABC transporter ATP-binding protein [Candidatus Fermentithermobacillaceae bacterium]